MIGRVQASLLGIVFIVASGFAPSDPVLLHYWNFNTTLLASTVGTGSISGTGELVSEMGEGFNGANARNGDPASAHLLANLSSGGTLDFNFSTAGYRNIVVKYETSRSGSDAGLQTVSYTLNGIDYTEFTTISLSDGTPEVITLDFGSVQGAEDNASFGVRFEFETGSSSDDEYNRFDNFTVEGTPTPQIQLAHYWNFNGTNFLDPTIGNGIISYDLSPTGAVVSDPATDQDFVAANARNGDVAGSHLRANNPIGTSLRFNFSTKDYEDIVVKYETRRSGSGSRVQKISYTVNGTDYTEFSTITVGPTPEVFTFNFSIIGEANDNPNFGIRIEFEQGAGGGTAGNNRIDNFSVEGVYIGELAPVLTDAVILTSPANEATGIYIKPNLTWEALTDASSYKIQISEVEDFSTVVIDATRSQTDLAVSTQLGFNKTYYWHVRGSNSSGDGPWSQTRTFTTAVSFSGSTLRLNEVMSSNKNFVKDDDGDNSDWLEVYNDGDDPVDLTGFGLSDNPSQPYKWSFPAVTINPREFLVVWASNKNRTDPDAPLHTNYAISADGETLTLTTNDGILVDQYAAPAMTDDIAYGRNPDGSGMWTLMEIPTPGATNSSGVQPLNASVSFSRESGFYDGEFDLNLTSDDPDVTIIYTLDGSMPDPAKLGGVTYKYKLQYPYEPGDPVGDLIDQAYQTLTFTDPIHIVDRSADPNKISGITTTREKSAVYVPGPVNKATVVKARAYKPGFAPGPVASNTYFIGPREHHQLPVFSFSTDEDRLFDYNNGSYVPGVDFDNWRAANPELSSGGDSPANYQRDIEFPASIQFFEQSSTTAQINQNITSKLSGNVSLSFPSKSLRFKSGGVGLNYKFFPDRPMETYDNILLRNAGQDFPFTLFRDAAIQRSVQHTNVGVQAYRPSVLYINGEYWGIMHLRERLDEHYVAGNFGVDPNNIDLIEVREVKKGDIDTYTQMLLYIDSHDMAEDVVYETVQQMMDTENFIDYQIAEIFHANRDWPANNFMLWRTRNVFNPNGNPYSDGRFRWMIKDTDFGWSEGVDMIAWATAVGGPEWPNPDWATFLLRNHLKNDRFKKQFINRFADLLNTAFTPSRLTNLINELKAELASEIPNHISRWGMPRNWERDIADMVAFVNERQKRQREHIVDNFELAAMHTLTLDRNEAAGGYVRVNTIDILPTTVGVSESPYPWTGTYFSGIPINLTAVPAPGYRFVKWEGASLPSEKEILVDMNEALQIKAIFELDLLTPPPPTPLQAPVLVEPMAVALHQPLVPVFKWKATEDILSYKLEVSKTEDFEETIFVHIFEGTEGVLPENLDFASTYYWRVTAISESEQVVSEVRSFATFASPPVVSVVSNFVEGTATVTWTEVEDAVEYAVQMAANANFEVNVLERSTKSTQLVVADLPDGIYQVRVRVIYPNNVGIWSDSKTIEISQVLGFGETSLSAIQAYPNPVTRKTLLSIPDEVKVRSMYLIDGVGRSWPLPISKEIDFSDKPAGVFLLKITTQTGESTTLKLVKVQ